MTVGLVAALLNLHPKEPVKEKQQAQTTKLQSILLFNCSTNKFYSDPFQIQQQPQQQK